MQKETKPLKPLIVLADMRHRGKHPLHDCRYIATAGAHFEEFRYPGQWEIEEGSVIATMTDCQEQARYARLFAAAPELLEACKAALQAIPEYTACFDAATGGSSSTPTILESMLRAAIAKAEVQS